MSKTGLGKAMLGLLLFTALLWTGCWFGGSTAHVTLDADRDRWELPRTAERVSLRRQPDMAVRVELVNSTDQNMTVEKSDEARDYLFDFGHGLYRDEQMLSVKVTELKASARRIELRPGQSEFHEINLALYSLGEPLPAGLYRMKITFWPSELKGEHPLLEKWVDIEIVQ